MNFTSYFRSAFRVPEFRLSQLAIFIVLLGVLEGGVCGCECVGGSCVWVWVRWREVCVGVGVLEGRVCGYVWWRVVCVGVGVLEGGVCGCGCVGGWCVWVCMVEGGVCG